jgi:hypothetical protein
MGLFSALFGGSSATSDGDANDEETPLTCDSCGDDVDESDMQEGQCEECYNSDYSGTTYCCGAIYEEGEDTCLSCGETL